MLKIQTVRIVQVTAIVAVGLLLCACGGADPNPPVANAVALTTAEDTAISNKLTATTSQEDPLVFRVSAQPTHGSVIVNANTGDFTYSPGQDYVGDDTFLFEAKAGKLTSIPQAVRILVTPVNDPPVFRAISTLTNSAESLVLTYNLPVIDVDADSLDVSTIVDDPSIATVTSNGSDLTLSILPVSRGVTRVHVTVRDSEWSATQSFDFSVGDVTKARQIEADDAAGDAITMVNDSDAPVVFTLEHNGFPQFQSKEEIVAFVRAMAPVEDGEPFEHKLWRFVRDNVSHNAPLNADQWLYDTWAVLNSQGWGFCGHAAAVYVEIARTAGYEARIWGLTGHVVPEIKINGEWQVFDPDLAIYYHTTDKRVAGVSELSADSSLISAPVDAIFSDTSALVAYSPMIADFYGSPQDNFLGDYLFLAESSSEFQPVTLPPRAELTYPGRWTSSVMGVDGTAPYPVSYYLQGMLTTPADFTGTLDLPWMLWEIRGTGRVRIEGNEYDVGSDELTSLIQRPGRQIASVEVLDAQTSIEFIVFMNAMRYVLRPTNSVQIKGKDVWAVRVGKGTLAHEARTEAALSTPHLKPTP